MAISDDILWARLEARADLFEATRLRYRALLGMVRGFFWRERLRRNVELLREVAQTQAEVEAALEATRRRAEAEAWPSNSAPMRLVTQVVSMAESLRAAVDRRRRGSLGPKHVGLGESLLALEANLLGEPRSFLYPGAAMAAAHELLPRNLPELRVLVRSAKTLETIATRPETTDGTLPITPVEATELAGALTDAQSSLRALRARVATLEATGTVLRVLDAKSRQPPKRSPDRGADQLLHGAFFLQLAHARTARWLEFVSRPIKLDDEEIVPLLQWIGDAAKDPSRTFTIEGEDARAGLIELCIRLAPSITRRKVIALATEEVRSAALRADGADPIAKGAVLSGLFGSSADRAKSLQVAVGGWLRKHEQNAQLTA